VTLVWEIGAEAYDVKVARAYDSISAVDTQIKIIGMRRSDRWLAKAIDKFKTQLAINLANVVRC
jgi:hypothetical protein